jgi:hypothetical protein
MQIPGGFRCLFAREFAQPLSCSRDDFAEHRGITAALIVETAPAGRRGFERSAHPFGMVVNDTPKHSKGVASAVGVEQKSNCFRALRRVGQLKVRRLVLQPPFDKQPDRMVVEWKVLTGFSRPRLGIRNRREN